MSKQVVRRKQRGQALVIIAGALVALLALVALAVDGSNAFAQRRIAQNAVDGATMAGQAKLAELFASHTIWDNGVPKVNNITSSEDRLVMKKAIQDTLQANGAAYADLNDPGSSTQAVYVLQDGTRWGPVGGGRPVPFAGGLGPGSSGVQGIWVQSTVQHETYFARIIGVDHVGSDAHAGGMIEGIKGVGDTQDQVLTPFTIFTVNPPSTPNLHGSISLSVYNQRHNVGGWGLTCFRGSNAANYACSTAQINNWLQNGFNPGNPAPSAGGPVVDKEFANGNLNYGPGALVNYAYLPIGNDGDTSHANSTGFWAGPSPQTTLDPITANLIQQAINTHRVVFVPIANRDWVDGHNNGLVYHVTNIVRFQFTGGSATGTITGRFLNWNWNPASVRASLRLDPAVVNGQTVLQLGP